jgi:O-antigen ligase
MKVVTDSLSYRVVRQGWRWLAMAARHSLVGRALLALVRVLGPVFADSRTFGTRHLVTRPLTRDGHSLSVLALARPYLWLRAALGGGAVGRAMGAVEAEAARSRFAGGAWVRVAGAGLFTLGCGRLVLLLTRGVTTVDGTEVALATPGLRLITPLIVLVVGALVFAAGPRLLPAFASGLVGRGLRLATAGGASGSGPGIGPGGLPGRAVGGGPGAGVAAAESQPGRGGFRRAFGGPVVATAVVLAAVAGAAAGLTVGSGALLVVAVVVTLCLFGLTVLRPEVMLLAVAAFPWLDWAARRLLGGMGPAWDDALLLFSIALLLWSVIVLRRGELWTVPIALPALLALVAAVGSVVVRDVPSDVALFALRVLFQPLLFYFLGYLFPKSKNWVQGAVAVFLLAGVALALHGLYQYATHAPMPASWLDVRETDISTRAYSIVMNPNGLGAFLLLGILISLSLALAPGLRRAYRVWPALACVIQLGGVLVTFSRGAWIGLGVGVVALLLLAYRRYLAPLIAAGVVAWFVMPQAFINRLTFAFSSTYITKSLAAGRLYVWKMSLQHIAEHPWFGVGLGTFGGTSAVTFGYGRLWVDNFYLQLAAEGGLLLLAFFLWILLRGARGLVKGHGAARDPYTRALCAGAFGAFVAVAVANFTASVWETLIVGVGFWFLTGLATSAALHGETRARPSSPADLASEGER